MKITALFTVLGIAIAAVFLFGIVQLFLVRFGAGDVYPYYSSLREDPLGVKAYYESLQSCCGLSVRRNYEPLSNLKNENRPVVFILGLDAGEMYGVPQSIVRDIDYIISSGGHVILAFLPRATESPSLEEIQKSLSNVEKNDEMGFLSLADHWGFQMNEEALPKTFAPVFATWTAGYNNFGGPVSCHTALYFDKLQEAWHPVLTRNGHAVLIERKWGKGTIVLSALSYFLSNEAMVRERHPRLLAWLIGDHRQVIFDEYHLGISSSPGVATLVTKYRLQWLVVVFIVLALLFVWQNAVPFVPPDDEAVVREKLGKESTAGLTNLLRRNVGSANLLSVCFEEWKKSAAGEDAKRKLPRIESIVRSEQNKPSLQRDVVTAYHSIWRILKEKSPL